MGLDFGYRKKSIRSVQIHSEAMRSRGRLTPLIRQTSRADTYPTECQYPVRDPTKQELRRGDETWRCLAATKPRSSYCEHHHSICYTRIVQLTDLI